MNERPIIAVNDPGLATIRYRPARYADVKAAMVRALSDARRPGLLMLGARDDRDLTIALIDAFAVLADSIGFYVERSAREAWLRTAEEPLSIRMLARQVGYELRPAIAAEAQLAFELVATADAPARLELPPGMQVQSIPGPGELPQTFETIEPLVARPIWNAIAPRRSAPQDADPLQPDPSRPVRWVTGVGLDLRPGRPVIHVHQDNTGSRL
ncbi:MAG TPA: putative baseplate assembly protein, partial [Bradyrhizobium sp.]|nr:putative baseplate assembly protein [Bradyrhizobium sp.]